MGNRRGTGSAPLGPPAHVAIQSDRTSERRSVVPAWLRFTAPAVNEITRHRVPEIEPDDGADDRTPELDIEAEFNRKIAGLRRLPRRERPAALRAARAARQLALRILRDMCAGRRRADHMRRRLRNAEPG